MDDGISNNLPYRTKEIEVGGVYVLTPNAVNSIAVVARQLEVTTGMNTAA